MNASLVATSASAAAADLGVSAAAGLPGAAALHVPPAAGGVLVRRHVCSIVLGCHEEVFEADGGFGLLP